MTFKRAIAGFEPRLKFDIMGETVRHQNLIKPKFEQTSR